MSYSSANPKPPCVWTATLAASHDASAASSFAMLASAPHGSPRSNSSAARTRIRSAASTFTCARAIGNCTPWFCPIGRLNTTRSFAYFVARSTNQRRSLQPNRLKPQLAARNLRQERALLRLRSVAQQRPHRVHLRVARAGVAAAAVDLFENDRRFGDAEAVSAVLLRDQRGEVAALGERADEGVGIRAHAVEVAPVAVGKGFAQIAYGAAQIAMEIGGRHADDDTRS